ncbi:DUF2252 domain-containing protein [Propionibacterium sp.]|uniref:DUF2252 domain-containing protein n=1 Tax=Propionibacterium sp. TaxID=1977903 RepID=UPI0039EB1F43
MDDTLTMIQQLTSDEWAERGRRQRKDIPRSSLASLTPSTEDPVDILTEQNTSRVADLVPLRFARMLTDPFSFFRGSAALMTADLAASPHTNLPVISCGDAHISNFGLYASPERDLVFDLNDFDETAVSPFEWDLKRLVASLVVGGRQAGYSAQSVRESAVSAVDQYISGVRDLIELGVMERYHLHVEPELMESRVSPALRQVIDETTRRARKRTSKRAARRLTEIDAQGNLRFRDDPPVLTHVGEENESELRQTILTYLAGLEPDIALLLSQFRLLDVARRVVGVGSIGTRCYIALLIGPTGEALILQVKEATASVLTTWGHQEQPEPLARFVSELGQGARVVGGQKMLQGVSDPFLGAVRSGGHDYYIRQFHDMKGSVDVDSMDEEVFGEYGRACALLLARAHGQSPTLGSVVSYIGGGKPLRTAIVDFAESYADKSEEDFEKLTEAARTGSVPVAPDPAR